MLVQSKEEIFRIFDEWGRHYAPPNFIQNEKNAALLADYVFETYGIVSITYLTKAVAALGNRLDYQPEPPKKTAKQIAAEFEAKELVRIQREQIENSKPFDMSQKIAAQQKADEEAKRQATAQAQIDNIIHNFSVNAGPGRIDHTRSDAGRSALRGIRINRNGKYDATLTLRVIQQAHLHDDVSSIIRAAQKATEELDEKSKEKPQRDSLGEDVKKVGILGGM